MNGFFEQLAPQQNKSKEASGFFESLQEEKPSYGQEALRYGTRSASRAIETAAGLPGDILSLIQQGVGYGAEKLTGNELIGEAIRKGPSSIESDEFTPGTVPTSGELKELSEGLTKGYTAPKNELERFSDEVISDITSLALPVKGKIPFLKSIGLALGANAAKEGAKAFGGSETTQSAVKLGSLFLGGLGTGKKAKTYVQDLYEKSKQSIPKNTMFETGSLLNNLKKTETELTKGIPTPTKDIVLKSLKDIENKAAGGAMPFEDLVQAHHDINEVI